MNDKKIKEAIQQYIETKADNMLSETEERHDLSSLDEKCKFQPLSTTCTEKQLHVHGDSAPLSRA